jgi:hypothetical protein
MKSERPLAEIADIVRSKNAGPYRITFDIMFKDRDTFERVRRSGAVTPRTIASAYRVPLDAISSFFEIEMANAIKATIKRPMPQGMVGDGDMYGCQQHAPLLSLMVADEP